MGVPDQANSAPGPEDPRVQRGRKEADGADEPVWWAPQWGHVRVVEWALLGDSHLALCVGGRHVGMNYFSDSDHENKIGRSPHPSPWGNPKFSLNFSGS